jgi:heterotetrameric sarcosine oxidase delta subunit
MRIPCPYCGPRDVGEFSYRGDAAPIRPAAEAGEDAAFDYVYMRQNPQGLIREHWYHAAGCRRWLVVERDTKTHVIWSATLAGGSGS